MTEPSADEPPVTNNNTPRRTFRIPDEEWIPAKQAIEANGETITDVVRAALRRYVARKGKAAKPEGPRA